jgi:RNA polymerase sigma-70 factor (ECF subfamily)
MSKSGEMKDFLGLLSSHERFLTAYVYGLIPNASDAEDVLQEVKLALWENFEQFEMGTSFAAWSRQVAFYRVIGFRKKKARENERLTFSDTCVELLDKSASSTHEMISEELDRLNSCLQKLSQTGQEMIHLKYKEEFTIEEIATRMGKSVDACYKALSRFRLQLRNCLIK